MGNCSSFVQKLSLTFVHTFSSCYAILQASRAREVYKMLHKYKIKGSPEVYTIAVSNCSDTGDLDFALSIYDDMTRNKVLPDEVFLFLCLVSYSLRQSVLNLNIIVLINL